MSILSSLLLLLLPSPALAGGMAYLGATLWDGTGSAPIPNATLWVEDGRIKAVGAAMHLPADMKTVDISGKWVIPGLVDSHIHFFQSAGLYTRPDVVDLRVMRSYEADQAQIQEEMDLLFRRYLATGITSVVDVGGPFWNFDVRQRAAEADAAPRVCAAGPLISTVARPQLDLGDPPIIRADSVKHAREMVDEQVKAGADFIKLWYIVTPDRNEEETLAITRAVVERAHARGLRVMAHATELESARKVVEAGVDMLAHSVDDGPVDQALLDLLAARGTRLISTLVVYEGYAEVLGQQVDLTDWEQQYGDAAVMASWDELAFAPATAIDEDRMAARLERMRSRPAIQQANLLPVWNAGIPVAAGTDAGNIGTLHGPSLWRELELLEQAGLSREQVLLAATNNAAHIFAAEPEQGTLEPGKLADFLVLDGDPLADLHNLQHIHQVVLGGQAHYPADLMAPNPEWVVQQQVDAYNARDLEAFLAWYHPEVIIHRLIEGDSTMQGVAAMREVYGPLFQQSPDLQCNILQRTVSDGLVVDHELVTGLRAGPPVRAVAIYRVEHGAIRELWFGPKE